MVCVFRCPQCHKRIGGSVIAVHAPRYVFPFSLEVS